MVAKFIHEFINLGSEMHGWYTFDFVAECVLATRNITIREIAS